MVHHFWTTFLLSFSFLVLLFGGYNCAQRTEFPTGKGALLDMNPGGGYVGISPPNSPVAGAPTPEADTTSSSSTGRGLSNLPPEPRDRCDRSEYRELEKRYGAPAFIVFNKGNLEEYRLDICRAPAGALQISTWKSS